MASSSETCNSPGIVDGYYSDHWHDEVVKLLSIAQNGQKVPLDRRLLSVCKTLADEDVEGHSPQIQDARQYIKLHERCREETRLENRSLLSWNRDDISKSPDDSAQEDDCVFLIAFTTDAQYNPASENPYIPGIDICEDPECECRHLEDESDDGQGTTEFVDWPLAGDKAIVWTEQAITYARWILEQQGRSLWAGGGEQTFVIKSIEEVGPEAEMDPNAPISWDLYEATPGIRRKS